MIFEDKLGDELITNGTFDTDSDWIKGTDWSISSSQAIHNGSASSILQNITTEEGNAYILSYDRERLTALNIIFCRNTNFRIISKYRL